MKDVKTVTYDDYKKEQEIVRKKLEKISVRNGLSVGSVSILFRGAKNETVKPYVDTVEEIDTMSLDKLRAFCVVLKKATKLAKSFRYSDYKVTDWN